MTENIPQDPLAIPAKFEDAYLRKLSIMDHITEIKTIYTQWVIEKNLDRTENAEHAYAHFEKELADLYLLLSKHFKDKPEIVATRKEKFWAKSRNSK